MLKQDLINIRKTEESDIKFIVSCLENKSDVFVNQCGYGKRFFTSPITQKQILNFQNSRNQDSEFFTILNNDIIIGSFELRKYDAEKKGTVARFLIYDRYRFKGYGTTALKILKDYAFDNLGLIKINLGVFDFNESALKCYKKAGFTEYERTHFEEDNLIRIDMELKK